MYPIILWKNQMALGQKDDPDPRGDFFFAQDFPLPRKENTWDPFPTSILIQPEKILPLPPFQSLVIPELLDCDYFPTYASWAESIRHFKDEPSLKKVVLARRTSYTFEAPLDPISFFFALREIPNTLPFAFILSPSLAFVGATPELLYKRKGKELLTAALAGTRPLSQEYDLINSPKERDEFNYVKEALIQDLQKIAEPFTVSDRLHIKRTHNLAHLYCPFTVTLKKNLSDEELIAYLHPTPALAGVPKIQALHFIQNHEPFDRGWYAGCIGHTRADTTEAYVAIRSGMINKDSLHLFSGAGILPASSPLAEWEELNHKIASFPISNYQKNI